MIIHSDGTLYIDAEVSYPRNSVPKPICFVTLHRITILKFDLKDPYVGTWRLLEEVLMYILIRLSRSVQMYHKNKLYEYHQAFEIIKWPQVECLHRI